MKQLIVIGYENSTQAEAARDKLLAMSREYLVEISDAVVASVNKKGNIKLNQLVNLWVAGASGGAFWGLLVGLLFFHPLFGVAAGAAAGSIAGALGDYGINDPFMRRVADVLKPGHAALFLMCRPPISDHVIEELAELGGTVIRTNLDPDKERAVHDAFAAAHAELTADETV